MVTIPELDEEYTRLQRAIRALQTQRAVIAVEIAQERQMEVKKLTSIATASEHLPQNEEETKPVVQDRIPSTK